MGVVKVMKIALIVYNSIFLIAGAALLGAGIWMSLNIGFSTVLGSTGNVSALFAGSMIAIGGAVMIIAFLGCCGAITESSCMLQTFNFILIIFILLEIGIATAALIVAPNLRSYLQEPAKTAIQSSYGIPGQESLTSSYDQMQQDHSCCGFNNGDDFVGAAYLSIPGATTYTHPWPQSCCKPGATATECRDTNPPVNSNNKNGCFNFVESLVLQYRNVVASVMFLLAFFQLNVVIFAYCIICSSGKNSVGSY